jgi:hypothetical protein
LAADALSPRRPELFYTAAFRSIRFSLAWSRRDGGGSRRVALDRHAARVDYRVNNRFLKSRSLADRFASAAVASVTFDYYPATGNLPDRLHRFQTQRDQARAKRERRIAVHEHTAAPVARADTTTNAPATPSRDSVMTYFAFPENVEPEGDIVGDEESGLQGRVLIRSRVGNPLMNATAVSHPFSHFAAMRSARHVLWAKVLALLALFALFALATRRFPSERTTRWVVARSALFAAFMVILRYGLLSFDSAAPQPPLRPVR